MTTTRLDLSFAVHPKREPATTVLVGSGVLDEALTADAPDGDLARWAAGRTVFAVTDPKILALHGTALEPLRAVASRLVFLEVPEGEVAKSLDTAGRLWREMLQSGGKRDSRVVAFGGGSVGDLAGFVAGGFLRGIEVVQVPTTLLAQVDAALGGKTAVDLPQGKNTVGLFHHPRYVISDTRFLATLPAGELRSGLVEVVKMAYLLDPRLLARVEDDLEGLLAGDADLLAPVVAGAAEAKLSVVERDPTEQGLRKLLNFGHTLGHAIETALTYDGTLRHGEAVAYGMLFALRLAGARGLSSDDASRLVRLLERFDLPPLPAERLEVEALVTAMGRDKKARESGLGWVLPRRLGHGETVGDVSPDEVRRELSAFLADPWTL
jgi:3-dehydroquinate synthase